MSIYFCPYCNPKYQFELKNNSNKLICGICGEEMVKKKFVSIKQFISIAIVITFVLPLFYSFIISILNRNQFKKDIYQRYSLELKKSLN
tara:strand:+ start:322 stop:588 length:267 start_codon:yes stop_codon:yes gene_type:complete